MPIQTPEIPPLDARLRSAIVSRWTGWPGIGGQSGRGKVVSQGTFRGNVLRSYTSFNRQDPSRSVRSSGGLQSVLDSSTAYRTQAAPAFVCLSFASHWPAVTANFQLIPAVKNIFAWNRACLSTPSRSITHQLRKRRNAASIHPLIFADQRYRSINS